MKACCSSANHPNDFICKYVKMRPACKKAIQRAYSSAHFRSVANVPSRGSDDSASEGSEWLGQPLSDWLNGFLKAIDLADTEPSTRQLLALAEAFRVEGFIEEARKVVELLASRVQGATLVHTTIADAWEELSTALA